MDVNHVAQSRRSCAVAGFQYAPRWSQWGRAKQHNTLQLAVGGDSNDGVRVAFSVSDDAKHALGHRAVVQKDGTRAKVMPFGVHECLCRFAREGRDVSTGNGDGLFVFRRRTSRNGGLASGHLTRAVVRRMNERMNE